MKTLSLSFAKLLFTILLGCGLLAVNVQAQEYHTATVTIPFAFSLNGRNIAPGTYRLRLVSEWLLSIHNLHGGGEQMFIVRPEQGGQTAGEACLLFDRFEGHTDLAEMYLPGSEAHTEFIGPHRAGTTDARVCSSSDSASRDAASTASRQGTAGKPGPVSVPRTAGAQ
jgi:hypothetical protein